MVGKKESIESLRNLIKDAENVALECKDEDKQHGVKSLLESVAMANQIVDIIEKDTNSLVVTDFQLLLATCVSILVTRPDILQTINLSILMALFEAK